LKRIRKTYKSPVKQPRQYSLVKLTSQDLEIAFKNDDRLIYLGEIPNMPGHCIVMDYITGTVYSGYHICNFVELTEEEV